MTKQKDSEASKKASKKKQSQKKQSTGTEEFVEDKKNKNFDDHLNLNMSNLNDSFEVLETQNYLKLLLEDELSEFSSFYGVVDSNSAVNSTINAILKANNLYKQKERIDSIFDYSNATSFYMDDIHENSLKKLTKDSILKELNYYSKSISNSFKLHIINLKEKLSL